MLWNWSMPTAPTTSRPPLLSRAPDLARLAVARARERGWQVLGTLSAEPDELRQLIRAPEQAHPVVACLRTGVDAADATAREATARRDSHSEHVVGVVGGKVARGLPEGWLIVEHAPGGTLAALLARRHLIRADEAATILIGVASGLGALHEAGWSASGLALEGVVFRRDGCPAIDALRRACPLTESSAAADRLAYRAVAQHLCAAVPAPGGWRLLDAVDAALAPPRAGADRTPTAVWERMLAGVLATIEPGVVRLTESGTPHAPCPPSVAPSALPPGEADEPPGAPRRSQGELIDAGLSLINGHAEPTGRREPVSGQVAAASDRLHDTIPRQSFDSNGRRSATRTSLPRTSMVHSVSTSALDPVSAFEPAAELSDLLLDGRPIAHVAERVRSWFAVRKKLVAIVLIPAVVVGAALLLLPGGPAQNTSSESSAGAGASSATGAPSAAETSGSPSTPGSNGRSSPSGATPSTRAPASEGSLDASHLPTPPAKPDGATTAGGANSTAAQTESTVPGEPVAAATHLLRARHTCFTARVRQVSCVDEFVQDGSPVAATDRAAIEDGTAADGYDYAGAAVELVQRWGAAALVSVAPDRARTPKSEPASLLMVRSEAGWRLREVFP